MGRTRYCRDDPGPVVNSSPSDAAILEQAAVPRRRATLSVLCETGSLSLEALAAHVARRIETDSEPSPEHLAVSLYHNHLKHLSDVCLVVRDEATGVALHSNVEDSRVRALLQAGEGEWEALGTILGNERRERVVTIVDSRDALSRDELAEAIVGFEGAELGGPREAVQSARVSLHHVDLPKLDAAGVVEYDHDAGRVEIDEVPDAYREITDGVTALSA